MTPEKWSATFDARARGLVLSGRVLALPPRQATTDLVDALRARIEAAFAPWPPVEAESRTTPEDYRARSVAAIASCEGDATMRRTLADALAAVGVDPCLTFWDRMRLRVQTSRSTHDAGRDMTLPPHRDTWGSNVMAQINWWMPIYPVSAGRTLVLYPALFDRAVANSSDRWDFETLKVRRRAGDSTYPNLPVATEPPVCDGVPVVVDPGVLVAFSGAHLHASTPNRTALTRFSLEVRSVCVDDVRQGLGPANVDGRAPGVRLEWFRRMTDRERLDAVLARAS